MSKVKKKKRARPQLEKLENLAGGTLHTSSRGVPYLVVEECSVAWFTKGQHYRVFWPHPSGGNPQERTDFTEAEDVTEWLKEKEQVQNGTNGRV